MEVVAKAFLGFIFLYGMWVFPRDLVKWLWAKTHSEFREFTFLTYTGHYWRLNGSRRWLAASKLTDCLQDLHTETGSKSKKKSLSVEEGF